VIEAFLTASPASWVDLSPDLRRGEGVRAGYGIRGLTAVDRVASTGTLSFALNNGENNSAQTSGYYSPDHANVKPGFKTGVPVRLKITYSGTTYYKWRGTLNSIKPVPGLKGSRLVSCVGVDWMDDAAKYPLQQLAVQVNKRSDEIFSVIVAAVPRQPAAISAQVGADTYPYALDNTQDETARAISEFQRLAMSELSFIYIKGDTVQGGTLVYESRNYRPTHLTPVATLYGGILTLQPSRDRTQIRNSVIVTTHPRKVDAAATTVLFTLPTVAPSVGAGGVLTLTCAYRDPNTNQASRIGGTDTVNPVPTTDYLVNSQADGLGADLTASVVVVTTFGGNSALVEITNPTVTDGFITKLQLRGRGLYDYQQIPIRADDLASQAEVGLQTLSIDMPLQPNQEFGRQVALYELSLLAVSRTFLPSITFLANYSDAHMLAMLQTEISDRVAFSEPLSGLANSLSWIVNSVDIAILPEGQITCTWGLVPGDGTQYWQLGIVGSSELGLTTVLGL
jgi:hypothetical protein